MTDPLLEARARVLHDLATCGLDTGPVVSVVDEVLTARRWWVDQWPEGARFVACLVAQDVQEAVLDQGGRWPLCRSRHVAPDDDDEPQPHVLRVSPDLGEDPHWVCEEGGGVVAPVGALPG